MSEHIVNMYCEDSGVKCEEIVRCRDCKRCMAYAHSAYCDKFAHALPDGAVGGYCAWGEKRSE